MFQFVSNISIQDFKESTESTCTIENKKLTLTGKQRVLAGRLKKAQHHRLTNCTRRSSGECNRHKSLKPHFIKLAIMEKFGEKNQVEENSRKKKSYTGVLKHPLATSSKSAWQLQLRCLQPCPPGSTAI